PGLTSFDIPRVTCGDHMATGAAHGCSTTAHAPIVADSFPGRCADGPRARPPFGHAGTSLPTSSRMSVPMSFRRALALVPIGLLAACSERDSVAPATATVPRLDV